MQSSSTFIRISGSIPEVKNFASVNYWENIIAYWEPIKARCRRIRVVCSTYSHVVWAVQAQEKFAIFILFKLGIFILFLFLKTWQFNHKLGPLQTYCAWKTILTNDQIWSQEGFTNPNFPTLYSGLGKKIQLSIFFLNWEKLRSTLRATTKNPKISLWIGKKLGTTAELQPKNNIQNPSFEPIHELRKVLS